jgi:serine/threonine protein kinase
MIMSICRRLVHTLPNGQIGVQNKEGGGEGSLWISFDLQWARPAHDEDIFLRFQEQKDSPASGKKKAAGGGKSEAEEKAAAPEEVRQGRSPIRQPVFQVRDDASASAAAEFAWPSHELDEVLQLVTRLGSGASGDVWVARHNVDKFHVAVQLLSVNTDNVESANNVEASKEEVAKLVTYRHPCLVRYHHLWGPDAKNCMWLVMDLCEKRSVSHLLRATGSLLTERQLAHILSVALHGLEHLHNARSQLHQDVRPGTLFVTGSGRIKLGGYWSRLASERHDGSEEVEPAAELDTEAMLRRPPEVLQGQPFTYASDVWALGLAALELAEGKLPHSKLSASLITKAIVNGSPPALKLPFWSSKFRHFVRMCLLKDPNHRPVTGDLLSHPFILSAPGPECIKPLLVRLRYLPKSSPVLGSAAILRYHVASDQGDKASAPSAEHSFTSNSISERSNNAPTSNTQSQSLSTRWAAPEGLPSVLKQPTSVIYSKFSPKASKGGSTNMTLSDIEDEVEGIGALEIPPSPPKRNPPPSPPKRRPPAH